MNLRDELLHHVINTIKDQQLTNFDELHYHAFNEDYYIIGHYRADQWLKSHDISPWEAIEKVIEWEQGVIGEVCLKPEAINSEKIVNMYAFILGEELLSEFDLDQSPEDLIEALTDEISERNYLA